MGNSSKYSPNWTAFDPVQTALPCQIEAHGLVEELGRLHAVSFSGGKDSTYLLLEMIRRGMPIDLVLNADTRMEFPAMYEHIDKVDDFLFAERGIRITRLKSTRTFEKLMFDAVRTKTPDGDTGYGWPNAVVRWCTGQLKTHLIHEYTKQFALPPYEYVAIAADEQYRLAREQNQGALRRHPLVDWGVTEAQALAGCYEAGYTWDGLYEHFSRVSCWCCPLQSLDELRTLHALYPDVWAMLRDLDDRAVAQFGRDNPYGQFRKIESVRMLEFRFAFEQDWKKSHDSIRSRAFYRELNRLYTENFYADGSYFTGPSTPESTPWTKKQKVAELLSYVTDADLTKPLEEETIVEQGKYVYYSTQRPVDIGTYPKPPGNPPLEIVNFEERRRVENDTFLAWGTLTYAKPLTEKELSGYELRPSRRNPDVRRTMDEQAQAVGAWEVKNHIPEAKRLTWWYSDFGAYVPGDFVTPEQLAERYGFALKFPRVSGRPPKRHEPPQHEGR